MHFSNEKGQNLTKYSIFFAQLKKMLYLCTRIQIMNKIKK